MAWGNPALDSQRGAGLAVVAKLLPVTGDDSQGCIVIEAYER